MRLLFLNPTASMGGAERVLLDLLGVIRRAQPAWRLGLIVGNEGTLAEEARRLGVATVVMPFPREFARIGDAGLQGPYAWFTFARHAFAGSAAMAIYLRRLTRQIDSFQPTVIHSNGFKMHLLSALTKPAKVPLIWHFHDYLSSRRIASRLISRLCSRCNTIVAVSESVSQDIQRVLGRKAPPVVTVWNTVDLSRFTPQGPTTDLDRLSGLVPADPGTIKIGLVATFARWKGHLLFLKVMQALARDHDVRGYIVGGPLYETDGSQHSIDELKTALGNLGLLDRVGLTGFVKDSAAALRELDIVVHASTSPEPFGLVIAEAMATGRAVVVSKAGGVGELVDPETNALTYPQGDAAELTRQVARLVGDVAMRHSVGQAAHEAAVKQFNPLRLTTQMLDLYNRVEQAATI